MNRKVLITGGTGLIGKQLSKLLLARGYEVNILSRRAIRLPGINTFVWDIAKHQIDPLCIDGVDTIIHLAGEGIAESRWSSKRKQELINSRTQSIELIYSLLKTRAHTVKLVVSASGIGYYGDRGDEILTEESSAGTGFLTECCQAWENAVDQGAKLGLRVVKLRTGIVLSKNGGALKTIAAPIKYGLGSVLGSGKQWMPWIHMHDQIEMYRHAIEHETIEGVYNQAAPHPVTNRTFTQAIAKRLKKPLWLPPIPRFLLTLVLGEMGTLPLVSNRASSQKISITGFSFKYNTIEEALADIYP